MDFRSHITTKLTGRRGSGPDSTRDVAAAPVEFVVMRR